MGSSNRYAIFVGCCLVLALGLSPWVGAQTAGAPFTDESVFRRDFRDPEKEQFSIWPNIPFVSATDMEEYERDRGLFAKLHKLEADPPTVLAAISAVDSIYPHHQTMALAKLGISFNAELIGALDELVRVNHIAVPKLYFSFEGIAPNQIQRDISADKAVLGKLAQRAERITIVAYAHYTKLEGPQVRVTLTLVKLKTGQSQSFTVTSGVSEIGRSMAAAVFDYFYGRRFPSHGPIVQSGQEWLLPAPGHKDAMVPLSVAEAYCKSQGARLPSAEELAQAEAAGPYHDGVLLAPRSYYHLRGGVFYYSSPTSDPRGRAHAWDGRGSKDALYYCVKELNAMSTN